MSCLSEVRQAVAFLKKSSAKNFCSKSVLTLREAEQKFFGSFFQKRTFLLIVL
jgi:hypothetical protein